MKRSLYSSPARRLEVAAARRALVDPKSRQVNAALTLTPDSRWKAISARRVRNKKWTPRGASKVRGEELRPAAAKGRRAPQFSERLRRARPSRDRRAPPLR